MIRLDIELYCHTCDAFEAKTIKNEIFADNMKMCETIVTCKNKKLCNGIKRYLENERKHNDGC